MQVVNRLGERTDVDALGRQRATHRSQDLLQYRPESGRLVGHEVGELVNVPLGLEHEVPADEEVDTVVRDPVVILVDRPTG